MHILFLTDNYIPEANAPAVRTAEHAAEWIKLGCKVTVITCAPNFPKGKVFDGYVNRLWSKEVSSGITIIRVWTYMTPNSGVFRRTLDHLSFMIASCLAGLFVTKIDVIVGTSPQFFTVISARLLGAIKRVPWIYELRDLWPDSLRSVGVLKNSLIFRLLKKIEIHLYNSADHVVCVTDSFHKYLRAMNIPARKITIVKNGVNLNHFRRRHKDSKLILELGLEDKFVIGYIGTIGISHSLETILLAAKYLDRREWAKEVVFLFVGSGARDQELAKEASEMSNVIFAGQVDRENIRRYWSLLDLSITHLKNEKLFETVIPSKMFESIAMGIPILHGVTGESATFVRQNDVGLIFEPENYFDLVVQIKKIINDSRSLNQLAENCLNLAPTLCRKKLAFKMHKCIQEVYDNC